MIEASVVKTHETVWSGTLTPEQLAELLITGLRDPLGTPYGGMSLNVVRVEPAPDGAAALPTIHYDLVHDHDHYLKLLKPREGEGAFEPLSGDTVAD